jgi:putative ABC transport system permease protein
MLHDLRYTVRALAKRPSFAAGTILVLGLAVGVNTAVFSLINAFLLRPLPVRAPDELAFIYHSDERGYVPYEWYRGLRQIPDVFTDLAARSTDVGRLRMGPDVIPLQGESVTPNYFDLLGVAPKIGRGFHADENAPGASPVVIISEGLWKSQYGGDPQVLGRTLRLDADTVYSMLYSGFRDYTIVGVMPATFTGTGNLWQPADYWVLIEQRFVDIRASRADRPMRPGEGLDSRPAPPIGRLRPGVRLVQARAAIEAAVQDIVRNSAMRMKPGDTLRVAAGRRVRLPFQGPYVMDVPRATLTLGAVGTILLIIAGANLAGMLLARGVSRRFEIAIRLSLGVGRARLIRQLLLESVLLAIGAGAVGLFAARLLVAAAMHGLPSQIPGGTGVAVSVDVPVDLRVMAFAFASGLLTAVLVGLAPALQAIRVDVLTALAGTSSTTGQSRSRLRQFVLVPQIALALVLLLVTGVFVRVMLRAELAPGGYDPHHVVTLDVQVPKSQIDTSGQASAATYARERAAIRALQTRLLERLRSMSGVTNAALAEAVPDGVPLAFGGTSIIARSDYETTRQHRGVTVGYVSSGYFETMGIPLLRGRDFDVREQTDRPQSVIVSQRLADELWPGTDPIGQQMAEHWADSTYPIQWVTVIGVAASATRPQDEYPRPVFYFPIESSPFHGYRFLVRGAGNPATLAAAAKQAITSSDPSVIVSQARPLEEAVSGARYPRRFSAAILGASGTAAMLLAAIGVFALMSYAVAQRVGEIGVRMVLGAQRRDIVRLIVKDGAAIVIAGIVIGFALAFAAIRFASHAIVPLPDIDAATFVVVPAVLAAVVLLACYLPARRAARVDPLVVLRNT